MLRLASYDIVFQEIPGEVTLALNLSGCPNRCPGCHSPHLQRGVGVALTDQTLIGLLEQYGNAITCLCFMGGDAAPREIERLSLLVRRQTRGSIKTGWYSGAPLFPEGCSWQSFDYVKLGPYVERLGGLDSPTTNQRFYRISGEERVDLTDRFRRR